MSAGSGEPRPVREGEELDEAALSVYLESELGLTGALRIEQFPGGHSNLTYLITAGERELVLRRPPLGTRVKSAHDMGREHRVLSALAPHYPRAPRPIAYCDDESVIGAPFYLMERVRGLILRKRLPPGFALTEARAGAISRAVVDTLAELHNLDHRAVGLGDLGRPEGYIERQVSGWSERYRRAQTDEIGEMDAVAAWLAAEIPAGTRAALIHNDFKLDNMVLDPDDPGQVRGILDWEMATVGDPWMDLGTALCYWVEPGDPEPLRELRFGPTDAPGMWSRRQLLDRYREETGREIDNPLFFYVFGLFKLAGVVQQIYFRYVEGHTRDPRFAGFGMATRLLATHAARSIDAGAL
jgi:aminoglycoside phosphotransferase (APT) family kinase protein